MPSLAASSLYELSLVVHVIAVILAFGPLFAFPVIQATAERRDPHSLPFALTAMERIHRGIVVPSAVLVGITGLYQALDGPFRFGSDRWLDVGFALYLVILAAAVAVQGPAIGRARDAAQRMVGDPGPAGEIVPSDDYRGAARVPRLLAPALGVAVLFVVYLMQLKPF